VLVMTILVVVISVAAPSLGRFFRGRTLDSEARRLLALTRLGQTRAVSEGMPMLLWVDAKRRAYGLEEEPGFADRDEKAVEHTLHDDLNLEVIARPTEVTLGAGTPAQVVMLNRGVIAEARDSQALNRSARRALPAIRFLPDGTIGETSPSALRIYEQDGPSLWVTQSRFRLDYEIASQSEPETEAGR